jgi:O-antigen ligase
MFLYFLLRRSGKLVGLLTGGLVVVGLAAPVVAQVRVVALLTEGFMSDSSALKRLYRIQKTLVVFRQSPLDGWGWGSTGWVHSDLLQIAAMLGIFAFLAFIGWYLYTLMRVVRLYRTSKEPWVWEESVAFITFLVGFIVVLSIQAAIVLPQLIIPMWLLFAMAEQLPRLVKSPPGDTVQPALANPSG